MYTGNTYYAFVSIPVRVKEQARRPEKGRVPFVSIPVRVKERNDLHDRSYRNRYVSIPVRVKEQQDFVFLFIIHHTFCFVKWYFS